MWICRGDGDGDDEQIQVDLNRIQPHVQQAPEKATVVCWWFTHEMVILWDLTIKKCWFHADFMLISWDLMEFHGIS